MIVVWVKYRIYTFDKSKSTLFQNKQNRLLGIIHKNRQQYSYIFDYQYIFDDIITFSNDMFDEHNFECIKIEILFSMDKRKTKYIKI